MGGECVAPHVGGVAPTYSLYDTPVGRPHVADGFRPHVADDTHKHPKQQAHTTRIRST